VYELTTPSNQRTSSSTKMVHSIWFASPASDRAEMMPVAPRP
jgi:hypothetical protein